MISLKLEPMSVALSRMCCNDYVYEHTKRAEYVDRSVITCIVRLCTYSSVTHAGFIMIIFFFTSI